MQVVVSYPFYQELFLLLGDEFSHTAISLQSSVVHLWELPRVALWRQWWTH